MLEKKEFETNDFLWRLSSAVAVVSGLFSLIVFLLLIFNYVQIRNIDPIDNLLITQMRQEYASLPEKDDALAQRIRDLDLLNRKAFFTSQHHLRTGAVLLFIGVSIFMISFKGAFRWKRELPKLDETPTADKEFLAFAQSRQLITWAGVGILALGMASALLTESLVMKNANASVAPEGGDAAKAGDGKEPIQVAKAEIALPTWDSMEKNWPSFRGPGSLATAHFTTAPVDWDIATGSGVRWKVEIPLPGANSPVIWENKLFVSGADKDKREIYCFDINEGKVLWSKTVEDLPGGSQAPPKVSEDTGYAAPSMVAHGGRVFAIFAEGDLVAYDLDGNRLWGINVGVPQNHYGHSSSLLAYDKFLYVQLDQKVDPKLMALDVATGKQLWMAKRSTISWASPILAQTDFGPQLILNSEETVDAYDPITGTQLWSQVCLSGEVAPSPCYKNGIVFAANEYAVATAIQLEKPGDAIEPKVLWEYDEYLPEVASPVGDGERFYFGTSGGTLVCLNAKTGEKLWSEDMSDGFYSSPVLVGDRIYVADTGGKMYIVKASSTFELIATRDMGEQVFATPAFMDGRMYVRTQKHLYCIEQKANA
ncbi:MAG: PQQ-binding-like beta-propeller repeat protein [Candidatus Hydrogenedentes bacterium]|nr:PQQ-binding-like beta-propeller repeat protein [Candidatus Hydrogenedentota bacterium]